MKEPGTRERVIKMLWQKQFENTAWRDKFHLIRPLSLEDDYGALADKIIGVVRADIEDCFTLTDKRQPGPLNAPPNLWDRAVNFVVCGLFGIRAPID